MHVVYRTVIYVLHSCAALGRKFESRCVQNVFLDPTGHLLSVKCIIDQIFCISNLLARRWCVTIKQSTPTVLVLIEQKGETDKNAVAAWHSFLQEQTARIGVYFAAYIHMLVIIARCQIKVKLLVNSSCTVPADDHTAIII